MGMVFGEVTFDERGPTVDVLAARITELCGLPVAVHPPGPHDLDIYDQHAYLSFTAAPEEQLELFSYKPGAAKKYYNDFMEGFEHLPTARFAVGLNEPPGTQVIYLRSYIGHEPTLWMAAVIALEALGGQPREPLTFEDRQEYGKKITEEELNGRRDALHRQFKRAAWVSVLLLPIAIPLFLLQMLLMVVLLPWRLFKAWGEYSKLEDQQKHRKFMRAVPTQVDFVEVNTDDYPKLDRERLVQYTHAFEILGFVHAMDYRVDSDAPSYGTGFARLFFHPVHHCLAEVNQVFPDEQKPGDMRCMIATLFDDDWSLSTTDRKLPSLSYAWRRPRSLWSSHRWMKPQELFAEHLQRRQRMIDRLHLAIMKNLTVAVFIAFERHTMSERRAVLQMKTFSAIEAEMFHYDRHPIDEWLGDFEKHAAR